MQVNKYTNKQIYRLNIQIKFSETHYHHTKVLVTLGIYKKFQIL